MSYKAVIIYGYPDYNSKYGFKGGKFFNISTPEGDFMKALQVLELQENALKRIQGKFFQDDIFHADESEYEEFDKTFIEIIGTVFEKSKTKII